VKKISGLEENIKKLNEFKVTKLAEEKEMKAQNKKLDKKGKFLNEKEARLEIDKMKFESEKSKECYQQAVCETCKVNYKSRHELEKHKESVHMKSSSTQTENPILKDKIVQSTACEFAHEKQSQTVHEVAAVEEFVKYPCFYCGINIAGEYHLSQHRTKCQGTDKMGFARMPFGSFPVFAPSFPGFPPSFPGFPPNLSTFGSCPRFRK
jgi:hypothetical protein